MKTIEMSEKTYEQFITLKELIAKFAQEEVTDEQVMDFITRNMIESLGGMEGGHDHGHEHSHDQGGCGCCCSHDH